MNEQRETKVSLRYLPSFTSYTPETKCFPGEIARTGRLPTLAFLSNRGTHMTPYPNRCTVKLYMALTSGRFQAAIFGMLAASVVAFALV